MLFPRVIPCLLLRGTGLVKTVQFKNPAYVGDPINTVRIFNEQFVDELIFLDIHATTKKRQPQFKLIREIAEECFMPFAYGGGLRTIDDIRAVLSNGAEKAVINTAAWETPQLITEAADRFGSQSVVVSIDVKKNVLGKMRVRVAGGSKRIGMDPLEWAQKTVELGAGELMITSVDREGTYSGYDMELVRSITNAVDVPVIAHGGASCRQDLKKAVEEGGAAAAAAGGLFVYQGSHRNVLVNYPDREELDQIMGISNPFLKE